MVVEAWDTNLWDEAYVFDDNFPDTNISDWLNENTDPMAGAIVGAYDDVVPLIFDVDVAIEDIIYATGDAVSQEDKVLWYKEQISNIQESSVSKKNLGWTSLEQAIWAHLKGAFCEKSPTVCEKWALIEDNDSVIDQIGNVIDAALDGDAGAIGQLILIVAGVASGGWGAILTVGSTLYSFDQMANITTQQIENAYNQDSQNMNIDGWVGDMINGNITHWFAGGMMYNSPYAGNDYFNPEGVRTQHVFIGEKNKNMTKHLANKFGANHEYYKSLKTSSIGTDQYSVLSACKVV